MFKFLEKIIKSRGDLKQNSQSCILCGICQKKCHSGAITLNSAQKKWEWNTDKCKRCGTCVRKCPNKCLLIEKC